MNCKKNADVSKNSISKNKKNANAKHRFAGLRKMKNVLLILIAANT